MLSCNLQEHSDGDGDEDGDGDGDEDGDGHWPHIFALLIPPNCAVTLFTNAITAPATANAAYMFA